MNDRELIQRLSLALDGLLELVEREAEREAMMPSRNGLKPITWKMRLENLNKLLDAAADRAA